MARDIAHKLLYAFLGAATAAGAIALYWQTDAGKKNLLQTVAAGDQCVDGDFSELESDNTNDEDIQFVGCSGFF